MTRLPGTIRLNDWFCGAGGATQGAHLVAGVEPVLAANHDELAIATHAANFPGVEHVRGDIRDLDVAGHPYAELFWASPECTNWSQAKGAPADFARQPGLFGDPEISGDVARSRALMQDVIRYLDGMTLRQRPVLAGVVENVTDIRRWEHWPVWRSRIEHLGYRTRLIALNSMHAQSRQAPRAPQSRDRLYLAYWHSSLGRDPDWDRWLRPAAHCPACGEHVAAVQSWKKPGTDMGRYRAQYVYRCPKVACRGQILEPWFVPASAALDWTLPGERIGDRARPLSPRTIARIEAGIGKYAGPITLEAAGHTFERRPGVRTWPVTQPLKTLHTGASKALAVPMLVPAGGTWRTAAQPVTEAMPARTTRDTDGVLIPPSPDAAPQVTAAAVMARWAAIYGYDTGELRNPGQTALPTQTTVQGDGLITGTTRPTLACLPDVNDCLFRMLTPREIHAGMAFTPAYIVLGNQRQQVRQLGNAVTPPAAEVLIGALAECISGQEIPA